MYALRTRALMLLLIASSACSSAPRTTAITPASPTVTTNAEAIGRAREDSLRYPYIEADVRFMTNMIGHHAQAIEVAKWAASHGASAAVQRLADRIVNAQEDEIVIMQQWLIDRQKPVPSTGGHAHHAHMSGMLTEEQLAQLDRARGAEFDRLFLTLMIQHHKGAVDMVKELLAVPGAAVDLLVFKLSSDINVDQSTEIARMEQMLASLTNNQRN
jgi:uncharacterized protein (DUF305 family)